MNSIIKFTAAVCAALSLSVANAALVVSVDYDNPTIFGAGVSPGIVSNGGGSVESSQGFGSGDFFRNATLGTTSISLTGLGTSHDSLTFDLDLFILDSWDGSTTTGGVVPPDFFNVVIDGVTVFSETFDNFVLSDGTSGLTPTTGPSNLFNVGGATSWFDSLYDLEFTVAHSSDTVNVQLFASGAGYQGGIDESWAFDNWSITTAAVPEPGLIFLFGTGVVGLGFIRRNRTK